MEKITPKFKVGNKVKLKSGSPIMTIVELDMELSMATNKYDEFTGEVTCSWFDKSELKTNDFHQDTLIIENEK